MYAELHCKTNFTFLRGASHPDELVCQAASLGYQALAITDRHSLAGIVRAHGAAKDAGRKLLIGAELLPGDAPPLVLLATDRPAYARLSRLLTTGLRKAPKGECSLAVDDIAALGEGLIACIIPDMPDDPHAAPLPEGTFDHLDLAALHAYREIFGDRCYLLAELHRGPNDAGHLARLQELALQVQLPLAAAGDVHYHVPERMELQNALTAIRLGQSVHEIAGAQFPNAQRHLRPLSEITAAFASAPAALRHTCDIADRCTFNLDELHYEYPEELAPSGETPLEYLRRLTWQGARQRYPEGIPAKVRELLEHELALIAELHYEAYFLTVWDLVRFARSRGILCQGRGSAANSAVCFCLGITSVDPARMDVLFERFVSRERNEAPDIDVDFGHERREEVLQYLYEKYGRERAGMTAEVICYRPRSAVRDLGKALGFSLDRVDALAKNLEGYSREPNLADRCQMSGIDPASRQGRQLVLLVDQMLGFPRHLSQHVGGMVMTRGALCELVPIENAAMPERTVIQWNKDDLDELGILKVDCLALGMLTAIDKCFRLIAEQGGPQLTLATVPAEDPAVYEMCSRADTVGVFQIESRAQMSMLPRLRPRCFYDLVIEVAIVRPGPIQGEMVHPYLRRRAGEQEVTYPTEAIREVLHKTLGVPLFQEQAMRLAVVAAGFTPGEADQLRRAMAAWRRPGLIDQFRRRLIDGMLKRGLAPQFAQQVFTQIRGFGEYGFPESHATSFALLVYVSAWLKCHYPAAFTAALINSQPMGFYAPAQLVRDARQHGVPVRPVNVNHSDWDCTLEPAEPGERTAAVAEGDPHKAAASPWAIRLGMRMVAGLSQAYAKRLVDARQAGRFQSLSEFARRTQLAVPALDRLTSADAFGSLGIDRRQALWKTLGQEKQAGNLPLLADLCEEEEPLPLLPELDPQAQVHADYRTLGLTLRQHPIAFCREALTELGIAKAADLATWPVEKPVGVAGLVLMRQRPSTARGITFVTLEDETGVANLVIHQKTWERYYRIARRASVMIAHGRLERKHEVIHVVVRRLEDLTSRLENLQIASRDFR